MYEKLLALDRATYRSNNRRRDLKRLMLAEFGVCYWCDTPVKDYGMMPPGVRYPHDTATIDHVMSKYLRKKHQWSLKVLACEECNTRRSIEDTRLYQNTYEPFLKGKRKKLSTGDPIASV